MTTKPKTRKAKAPASAPKQRRARCVTEAEAAALDFEPWQGEVDTKTLPNNEQFSEHGVSHLITCRLALVMMYRTKAELNEMFEHDGNAMCDLIEGMGSAKHFFSHFSKLLDAAEARLIVAGSSVCQNTPQKCGDRGREWGNA
jgi:hypothetical protein